MNIQEIYEIATAVLLSVGGGAAIVFALSSWLGKVWANRLMVSEKAKFESELEHLKAELNEEFEKNHLNYKEKIELYKEVSNPIIDIIILVHHQGKPTAEQMAVFDKRRLLITAQLAMFAPQSVFNKYNGFIDYIYNSFEGKEEYSFSKFREIALQFLSEIRKDIGVYTDNVTYTGSR